MYGYDSVGDVPTPAHDLSHDTDREQWVRRLLKERDRESGGTGAGVTASMIWALESVAIIEELAASLSSREPASTSDRKRAEERSSTSRTTTP